MAERYIKNMKTKRVFIMTEALSKKDDMRECDKDGRPLANMKATTNSMKSFVARLDALQLRALVELAKKKLEELEKVELPEATDPSKPVQKMKAVELETICRKRFGAELDRRLHISKLRKQYSGLMDGTLDAEDIAAGRWEPEEPEPEEQPEETEPEEEASEFEVGNTEE